MTVTADVSGFVLGHRCADCHRYLFQEHRPTRVDGRRWRHECCQGVPRPSDDRLADLAAVLVYRHSSRLTVRLLQQWADAERALIDLDVLEREGLSSMRLGEERRKLRDLLAEARAGLTREEAARAERVGLEWDELDHAV